MASTEKAILEARQLLRQNYYPGRSMKQVLEYHRNSKRRDGTRDGTCDTLFTNAAPKGIATYSRPSCEDPDCNVCKYHYRSETLQSQDIHAYERAVSDTEASKTLKDLVNSVEADRQWLRDVLVLRGDQFLNRWSKLKMRERKVIIELADGLEPEKWPQLNHYYNLDGDWVDKRKHRNAFLLPHLNVDALSEDKTRVLDLVFNRVEHAPHEFFHMDRGFMELGILSGILDRRYNAKGVLTTAKDYGALRTWANDLVHQGAMTGFPVAELVLQAQSVTMAALKKIVDATLTTAQGNSGCANWQSQGKERFGLSTRSADRFGVMLLERPYGPPPTRVFPIEQAKTDIGGRLSVYKGAMSALQCEPDYAQLCIASLRKSKILQALPLEDRWASMSFFIYAWHWFAVIAWSYIATSGAALLEHATEHIAQLPSQGTLSITDLDEDLVVNFLGSLSSAWIVSARCLSLLMIYKGTMDYSKYQKPNITMPQDKAFGKSTFGTASQRQQMFDTDRLLWVLNELTRPEFVDGMMPPIDRGTLLRYLADLLKDNSKKYDQLDEEVQMAMDDLLSIWELWWALGPETPFYVCISNNVGQVISAEWYTSDDRELCKSHWNEAGPLLQALSEAPWPKGKKSDAWLEKAAKARTQLTMFWDSWRGYWREALTTRVGTPDSVVSKFKWRELKYLENDLQESHRQECVQWEQTIRSGFKRKADSLTGTVPSFPSGPEAGGTGESYKKPKTGGKKTKKRPDPVDPALVPVEPVPAVVPSPPTSPLRAPILVRQGSLDLFARMWPTDSEDTKSNAVKWQTVLSAMTDAKCDTDTNGGSMVNFSWKEPDATNTHRLQFHRPHGPGSKDMSALRLRQMGYRLTEHFAWKWKRFQLRPRGED